MAKSHTPAASPLVAARTRACRHAAAIVFLLGLVLLVASQRRQLYRHVQNAVSWSQYDLDPHMLGRSEAQHPAPHCCTDERCAAAPGDRKAVVTYLRGDAYAPLLQQLECTLRRSNPGMELGLMAVPGELSDETLTLVHRLNITLLSVEPLQFPNTYDARCGGC